MNTRKKVIKTVYHDEESENEDFSASASEADVPDSSSADESSGDNSAEEFSQSIKRKSAKVHLGNSARGLGTRKKLQEDKKEKFAKRILSRLSQHEVTNETADEFAPPISVKDLTEQDKLLPAVLNLSESDSSDDEIPTNKKPPIKFTDQAGPSTEHTELQSDKEDSSSYTHDWAVNTKDSEEVAKKSFEQLQHHTNLLQHAKKTMEQYRSNKTRKIQGETDVKNLLILGEEEVETKLKMEDNSASEVEDWEEVKDSKPMPQTGIQLVVDFPAAAAKKSKAIDVEMMMRRKINRVKKEYQVYMHKVHVLCWLGHGIYVNKVLNDEELMAAALKLVPSEKSYPSGRVNTAYIIEISTWYRKQFKIVPDKHENKYKPNAPPLKEILLKQMKNKSVTSTKYLSHIFVCLMRALGIQCRIMLNFVTLPIKPPSSELCSLANKHKLIKNEDSASTEGKNTKPSKHTSKKAKKSANNDKNKIPQLDGIYDCLFSSTDSSDLDDYIIEQLDGNNDIDVDKPKRATRSSRLSLKTKDAKSDVTDDGVSPPKRKKHDTNKSDIEAKIEINTESSPGKKKLGKAAQLKTDQSSSSSANISINKTKLHNSNREKTDIDVNDKKTKQENPKNKKSAVKQKTSANIGKSEINANKDFKIKDNLSNESKNLKNKVLSQYFNDPYTSSVVKNSIPKITLNSNDITDTVETVAKELVPRKRGRTASPSTKQPSAKRDTSSADRPRTRSVPVKSTPKKTAETSKYFENMNSKSKRPNKNEKDENSLRVSHRDLAAQSKKKIKTMDVREDLKQLVKERVKEAKSTPRMKCVKGKTQADSDDSDYAPVEETRRPSSENDFKPKKSTTPKSLDRRVLSSDDEAVKRKGIDVWVEVFVEEEEQWIPVDVVKPLVHCAEKIYSSALHPVCYVVGWDNSNRLKDVTRRYVPHWNTATRRQRAEPAWWDAAVRPWLGAPTHRDREEDQQLDKMMYDAPLPKVISEYKNHPLYALKRHLLKFEALYPADAPPLGFVRGEAVYARACVHTCRSRDTWLKEAKTVRLGEKPYKIVKARPKWDKLSNRVISDIPLEVFGPWQVQDYEPPTAENGVVPRNAYGNVELFKECMLPKGTVHLQLPGLNKVAKKLNIDCAPAMTGFDFHGGWTHPVFDGFVVCQEHRDTLVEAWEQEQEEAERRELEKTEARVYGNWKKLIKGLLIRERLQEKYSFGTKNTTHRGPRLLVKKK